MANHEPDDDTVQHSLLLDSADVSEDASGRQAALGEPGTAIATLVSEARAELPISTTPTFDYSQIKDTGVRRDMEVTAASIRNRLNVAAIEAGRELLRHKKYEIEHGQWMAWVETLGFSVSGAGRKMRAAAWAEPKSSAVTNLPPTLLYILSAKSTPQAIHDDVLARIEAGETVSAAAVRWEMDRYREREQDAAR